MSLKARFIVEVGERPDGTAIYNTASGRPEPGDLFWTQHGSLKENGSAPCYLWDNCDGRHLYGILPNGHRWNIDGRARNCALPHDRLHRCWVRHGTPESGALHVDKAGLTCEAGAGSIDAAGWHGHLSHGYWVGPDVIVQPATAPSSIDSTATPAVPNWNPLLGGWEPLKK